MSFQSDYSEDSLVERPAIELFQSLGWDTANCYGETFGPGGTLGRETTNEVVLVSRLRPALERLNPDLSSEALQLAIDQVTQGRGTKSPVEANRDVYELLKDGVKVTVPGADDGDETVETVRLIDWNDPSNNDFFLASQFWITGEMYKRRTDLLGFVNGIPLVFIELKAAHKRLENAYKDNLRDYRDTIPQLFWHNALIILSNGSESKIGSVTSSWEHFSEWNKITSEGEEGIVSLETMIRGTCDPTRLLDLIENFAVFMETKGGAIKLVAKNHQFLGVNSALKAVDNIRDNRGRLGVFWHTQGSGKSVSMIFFAQKILRRVPGNWTFVIVTDRRDLDDQIYKNFAGAGVVTEQEAQATSGAHLRQLLSEDHRYVFTLIQKFRSEPGEAYPALSDRSDIIVITDEAHRSQYDTLALNMRTALPNASFLAFTGTPLIAGEERTKEVFGDYISVYNFRQSIEDGATVPLYYENRIPELELTNEDLNEDMERLLEEAELDEEQEKKLEREFARQYHLVTRDDRLEKVAEDLVTHFTSRGYLGKGMVVSIDKATAVGMYDKVRAQWGRRLDELRGELDSTTDPEQRAELEDLIRYMEETDMAVVVSQAQNEIDEMRKKGLDILPHRERIVKEDLDTKFKDPADPLRLVFVCAMWMTGFDVPSCSTIYLDKPMRNHTLMQTIARANRVFPEKVNGLIVDYVGVFRNLEKALAIYGTGSGGGIGGGDKPIWDKSAQVEELKKALGEAKGFCAEFKIDLAAIQAAEGLERIKLLDDAVDAILVNDESKKRFLSLAGVVETLHKAIRPHPAANELAPECTLFRVLAEKIRAITPAADISDVMQQVERLLDQSIATEGYVIKDGDRLVDLSQIDFEALRKRFEKGRKRTEVEKLKGEISGKLAQMVRLNRARIDFLEKFQAMIDEYNAGSVNVEEHFRRLMEFIERMKQEDARALGEQLTEEELAVFDLLTRPELKLTKKEAQAVKKVARELLATLKKEKLVLDWRKRQQSRAAVRVCIEEVLDLLPRTYSPETYRQKCDGVYQHVYDSYWGAGRGAYGTA